MMMDRNREARRAAGMSNGLQRRRHRPVTGSLRDSPPDDDGPLDLQETARLRDRTVKRDRDRDVRHRVDRDRERERLNRSKRRRGVDDGDGGGGGVDDSTEESFNDEDEEDDGPPPPAPPPTQPSMRYIPPSNPSPVSSSPALTHRKSYPPPTNMFRSTVAPTWKAPDEMIGFSIPRKARSASTKRPHDCWTSSSIGGEHILRQQSSSPVRSTTMATATVSNTASPLAAPMSPSPSSSNITIKKKIKPNGGSKQKGVPKPCPKSSPLIQEEIEIEVAEVLYGLMRQSQGPSTSKPETMENDSTKIDKSNCDSKSSVSPPHITTVAPKRKRPRPYPEENPKVEWDQVPKSEARSPTSDKDAAMVGPAVENWDLLSGINPVGTMANAVESEGMKVGAESKAEEITSSSKLESQLHHRVQSTSTSDEPNSTEKFEIDLMAPPVPWRGSPEREGGVEYRGNRGDDKSMVTDMEAEAKLNEEENEKERVKRNSTENVEFNVNRGKGECEVHADDSTTKSNPVIQDGGLHNQQQLLSNLDTRDHHKLDLDNHKPPSKATDTKPGGGPSSSMPMPLSVPAPWHGGLGPMGYVAPLQGVVSMDGTPMASPPVQAPHFIFSQPKPKRCATHSCIARSISVHQQMMKMSPFWPAAAAGSAPLFGAKLPYNLNMVAPVDLQAAARAGAVSSSSQDKGQPYSFFPGSKDKSPLTQPNAPDSAHKKQFLLPHNLPTGAPGNVMPAPAFYFPFGQQQAAAASAAGRPSATNSPSTGPSSASTPTSSMAPGVVGPAMTFSYPNMAGNEPQFMAILGNSPYPFPVPAHVGASTPFRGSQPQAVSFFNGSFYPSQMLHPLQLHQQQPTTTAQSLQIQQQNHQNPSISTSSSTSQQNQQQRLQGNAVSGGTAPNSNMQNFQATKNRPSQPHHEVGSEDSPSTADSRTRPNLGVYGQNFAMPFHSPNFALMGGGGTNAGGVPNGNHNDKKQQQSQQPAFPMSFASVKGPTAPGLDISSMANNQAILQSLPEAVRHNYQIMAAAAQAAQAANQRKNVTDTSGGEEERRVMASRTCAAPVGQSIAFSRDSGDNSMAVMPGNSVVDSSARSVNLGAGSNRPTRSSGPNTLANSSVSNPQQQQMLFPKQQQFVAATVAAAARSKTTSTSNGGAYPDHLTSKFPNNVPNFPLVQSSGAPSQWKNSVRPNTSQVSSPPVAISSTAATIKNLSQQQGRPQQNHNQISFASAATNPKPSPTSQGQQVSNSNPLSSSPMMVGSPSSSSVSKSAGGGTRTVTSSSTANKAGPQNCTLSTQQGKNPPSTSLSSQKPSILGSPHMMSTSSKPQSQESQQQPQLSKQSIQQAQLFFSNAYMQASGNSSAGGGYYLQRHRPENQQQQQTSKSQGSGPPTSSSGMLSLCTPVSLSNTSTSNPAKAAAAAANSMKGTLPPQSIFHAAQFAAAQPAGGGAHQLVSAGFPYVHAAASTTVQMKPAEQKQPAGE